MLEDEDEEYTLGEYIPQAHILSRSAYSMPTNTKRLIYAAMSSIKPGDKGFQPVSFTRAELVESMGLSRGGNSYDIIKDAVIGALQQIIEVRHPDGSWEAFQWLSRAKYDAKTDTFTIRIHGAMKPYILALQKGFSKLSLVDLGRLQGQYALRWFELVMSRKEQADKYGRWYYQITLEELRKIFAVAPHKYKRTGDFRTYIIDRPISEINNADLGIRIDLEYIRKRRSLIGVRANCRTVKRNDPKDPSTATETEENYESWVSYNLELFDTLLKEEMQQKELFDDKGFFAKLKAQERLINHPDAIDPRTAEPNKNKPGWKPKN